MRENVVDVIGPLSLAVEEKGWRGLCTVRLAVGVMVKAYQTCRL